MLAAICIPEFDAADLAWLQDVRGRFDPGQARLVAPHVTLVFPTLALPEADFVAHVSSCARVMNAVSAEFSSAREFREEGAGIEFVFLVPGAGMDWFIQAHHKLYSGALASERRRDSAFAPHITLGRFASSGEATSLAARINAERKPVIGRTEAIEVVHAGKSLVRHVHTAPLARG